MDFRRPVPALIPGVQGRILAVLVETTAELNLRTIARLAGVSPAQASRILPELVRLGVVERREAPPSALFRLVEANVAAVLLRSLSRARDSVLADLGRQASRLARRPVSVIVFGSFSRGDADADSDLDVVFVRPRGVTEDDERWAASVDDWSGYARRLTGNRVQVLEADEMSVGQLLRGRRPLWTDIARDGLVVYGKALDELRVRSA